MIEYLPFKAGHLQWLKPQTAQVAEHLALVNSDAADLLEGGISLSAWAHNRCVGAAGLIEIWPHRAMAWLILSEGAGPYMLPIARKVRRVVAACPYKRVELTVAADFERGRQFARLVGAKCETPQPMKGYGAEGRDEYMYAIVKESL